ncbi:MAG: TSUP family transporter [Ornithinimicrobium sp.]|uniref:TSUP family transporter n=1 Tax=Ornithinimicrobium sp. TaxID=1977084 RepID=UPI003D9B441C
MPSVLLSLPVVFAAFAVSAAVGLGGSLLMVPVLVLVLGVKEGVALAALLLALNNVVKVIAYRRTIPWRAAATVVVILMIGAAIGASLLVRAPDWVVGVAVLISFVASLALEQRQLRAAQRVAAPLLAFGAGATSGFSGTSGPLKGVALRNLGLDQAHFVGAASIASLAGDATKVAVFTEASLLGPEAFVLAGLALPLMLLGTATGRRINGWVSERGFAILFWAVMTGYSVRLVVVLF